ncbi:MULTISPECIES: hypothetical protein [Streptomyces]|uniref:hypothetical protein n=1 Tax=Streptomyces TaxID=1883 RepID=UPI0006EB3786
MNQRRSPDTGCRTTADLRCSVRSEPSAGHWWSMSWSRQYADTSSAPSVPNASAQLSPTSP